MTKIMHASIKYIVPFMFQPQDTMHFQDVVTSLSAQDNWTLRDMNNTEVEQDLYRIILNCFVMTQAQGNIGCAFQYDTKKEKSPLLQLNYTRFEKPFFVNVTQLELFLFRTGVAFLCYDIEIPKDATADEFVLFQNEFKELAYATFLQRDRRSNCYTLTLAADPNTPVLMGQWLDAIIAPLPFQYTYFAQRSNPSKPSCFIPDKALTFDYIVFDEAPHEQFMEYIYRITNGYNERYKIKTDIQGEFIEFFNNAYACTTMGGSGYYVLPVSDNKGFYTRTFVKKIKTDYFLMNILALYQFYSLLKFTNEMEQDLSADSDSYLADSEEILLKLKKLATEINVFLIKSVYSSVSHISHQNDYYEYLMRRLKIKENIRGLTIGLDALQTLQESQKAERLEDIERKESMEREMSDDRLNTGLGLLAILGIVSAPADGYGTIDVMMELFCLPEEMRIFLCMGLVMLIAMIFMVAMASILPSILRAKQKRKRWKKSKK